MQNIDWALMRFLFEVHGTSIEEIAADNDISESMVKYVHDKQEWCRSPAADEVRNWTNMPESEDELTQVIQSKMAVSSLLKQCSLNPRLQILEANVLNKAIEAVAALDFEDTPTPAVVASLQKLGDLVERLKASNPAIQMCNRKQEAQQIQDNSIKVQIITGYSNGGQQHQAIEVTPSVVEPEQIEHDGGFTQITV